MTIDFARLSRMFIRLKSAFTTNVSLFVFDDSYDLTIRATTALAPDHAFPSSISTF